MSISLTTIHSQHHFISSLHFPSTSNPNFTSFKCTSETPKSPKTEIRVCTNRTCRKQGSSQILETLSGISPPHVSVTSCGCLGRCGSGPNLVVLPPAAMISHCGTAARAADLMVDVCGGCGDGDGDGDGDVGRVAKRSLESLAFRKRGEVEFQKRNYSDAEVFFSQEFEKPLAAAVKPKKGVKLSLKKRKAEPAEEEAKKSKAEASSKRDDIPPTEKESHPAARKLSLELLLLQLLTRVPLSLRSA